MILRRTAILGLLMAASAAWGQWTIDKIVDNTTPCPGTKGTFNVNTEFPAIYGPWVVFLDAGDDKCTANDGPSIWSYNLTTKKLTKLADTETEIPAPSGAGKFTTFTPVSTSNLQVNEGLVLFYGAGAGSSKGCTGGLYTVPVSGGAIHRVVDYTMKLPGYGDGVFCNLDAASISGNTVAVSVGTRGSAYEDDGVWWVPANVNATEADFHLIADGSTIFQSDFPKNCVQPHCQTIYEWFDGFVSGSNVVFTGDGGNPGPYGIFLNSIANPILLSNTILPGDDGHESGYPALASFFSSPIIDGDSVYFLAIDMAYKGTCGNGGGSGQGNFTGVFRTSLGGGPPANILNSCDKQPSGYTLNGANSFENLAAGEGAAVFQVKEYKNAHTLNQVLDAWVDGRVSKLIGPGDPLPTGADCNGEYHAPNCVTQVSPPGTGGMSGGRVVFGVEGGPVWWYDGIYVASLPCAENLTSDVSIDLGTLSVDPVTRLRTQNVKVTNSSDRSIAGPLSLVLTRLTGGVSLENRSGTTVCFADPNSEYVDIAVASNALAPGKSVDVTLEFSGAGAVGFTPEVAGVGAR
jgi:hypothetical protein